MNPEIAGIRFALDLAEIFKPLLADRVIFTCLNQRRIQHTDFDASLNFCHLSKKGRKTFVKAFEDKLKPPLCTGRWGEKYHTVALFAWNAISW